MPRRLGRPLLIAAVVVAVLLGWLAYSYLVVHQERDVAAPAPDASPAEVVRAFDNGAA